MNNASPASSISPRKLFGIALLLLAACALPFFVSNYSVFQFSMVLSYAIALVGLNILTGYSGQISLGHGAFLAIGAYTTAILMDRYEIPYWATLPISGAICLVVGFLFGLPALRLEGHYLALATFALAVALPQLLKFKRLEEWTGGVQGIDCRACLRMRKPRRHAPNSVPSLCWPRCSRRCHATAGVACRKP